MPKLVEALEMRKILKHPITILVLLNLIILNFSINHLIYKNITLLKSVLLYEISDPRNPKFRLLKFRIFKFN